VVRDLRQRLWMRKGGDGGRLKRNIEILKKAPRCGHLPGPTKAAKAKAREEPIKPYERIASRDTGNETLRRTMHKC
jgi:hypothetical protein